MSMSRAAEGVSDVNAAREQNNINSIGGLDIRLA